MEKHNMPLVTEILREEVKRTRLWKTAFIVMFVVFIINCIVGCRHEN